MFHLIRKGRSLFVREAGALELKPAKDGERIEKHVLSYEKREDADAAGQAEAKAGKGEFLGLEKAAK